MSLQADFNLVHLIILALASYRMTRLIIEDVILEFLREKFWIKFPPESTMPGYWLTCYWCAGFAVSAFMILSYVLVPFVAIPVAAIFALSAVIGFIDHFMNR